MNNSKTKPETESLLRIPKAKPKLGLRVPHISMPHEDLISVEKPKLEIVPNYDAAPETGTVTRQTTHTSLSSQSSRGKDVAPPRNYRKVSSTITRQAISEGLFQGKSKQLYDVLYSLTRGATNPRREVRISKMKLMKQSGIGSRITFDACVERLKTVGLLQTTVYAGEHEGNSFKVILPEEIEVPTSQSSQSSQSQEIVRLDILETSQTSQSLNDEDTAVYENSENFFRSEEKTVDDESALDELTRTFEKMSRKYTGENLSKNEREKWKELAELLEMEFEVAAARTKSISSVPVFLTEHLRRRLA